jgi:hypothetical protein
LEVKKCHGSFAPNWIRVVRGVVEKTYLETEGSASCDQGIQNGKL